MSTNPNEQLLAVYVHIPFCQTRCSYCAFNTYTGLTDQMAPYMNALAREVRLVGNETHRPVHTLYFGGGTPSLIQVSGINTIIETCAEMFALSADAEITLEANPGSVNQTYLDDLLHIGVNRLSIGMQSAHEQELRLFGRGHSVEDVQTTVTMARRAGFDNISLDLIYGVPHQSFEMWQKSLDTALSFEPDHLSLYGLGLEDGTPMQRQVQRGKLPLPDDDLAADMYDWATERLEVAGFEQYEVSNWSKPGYACRHNIHYWRNLPYLGLGAGAHGYAAGIRYSNVLLPAHYIARINAQSGSRPFPLSAAAEEIIPIDAQESMAEMMLMGLRLLVEGVALDDFAARYGHDLWSVYGPELERMIEYGLVERTANDRVRLTKHGRLLSNRVFEEFV